MNYFNQIKTKILENSC